MRKKEITVRLEEPLAKFVVDAAERESRSIAGQIRYLIAQAAREEQPEAPKQAA